MTHPWNADEPGLTPPPQPPAPYGQQPAPYGQSLPPQPPAVQPPAAQPASPRGPGLTWLTGIPGQAWTRAFSVVGLLLGGSLVVSGIMVAVGLPVASTQEVPLGGKWFPFLVQLTGMGYGAPAHVSLSGGASEYAHLSMSLYFVPALVLVGGLLAVRLVGRRIKQGIAAPSWAPRLVLAISSGVAFATVLTVLAAIARVRFGVNEIPLVGDINLPIHTAGFLGYVLQFLISAAVVYVAFLPPMNAGYWRRTLRDVTVTVVEHLGSLALVLGLVLTIVVVIQGEEPQAILFAPLLLPYLGLNSVGLVHLVPVTMGASSGGRGADLLDELTDSGLSGARAQSLSVFSDGIPGWVWPIALVVTLAWAIVASLRWRARRGVPGATTTDPVSWALLPGGYLLAGLVMLASAWLGLRVKASVAEETFGDLTSGRASVSVHPQWWLFFVMALVGVIVEVASRFVAPGMARTMPRSVFLVLTWAVHRLPTTRTGYAAAPGTEGATLREDQQRPSKRAKFWWMTSLIAAVVIVVLAVGGSVTYRILSKTTFGPKAQAEDYLQAIVDGRAKDALTLYSPNVKKGERVLLTDEIYKNAKNRPTAFRIYDVTFDGDRAYVAYSITMDGQRDSHEELTFERDGKQAVVFSDWKLVSGLEQTVSVGSGPEKMKVNGVEVSLDGLSMADPSDVADDEDYSDSEGGTEYQVLPGDYVFTAPKASKYVSYGKDQTLTVRPRAREATEGFTARYTDAVETDAKKQVSDKIASCVGSKAEYPKGCAAAGWVWDEKKDQPFKMTSRAWDGQPEIEVGTDSDEDSESGVVAQLDARIKVEYQYKWDKEDDDWNDSSDTFTLGQDSESWSVPAFPVTIEGDKLSVDLSALDKKVDNNG